VFVGGDGLLVAAFSAESYTVRGFPTYVRLLVDGRAVSPYVFLTSYNRRQSRTILFQADGLSRGMHSFMVQAFGTTEPGFIGNRNLLVVSAPNQNFQSWGVQRPGQLQRQRVTRRWGTLPGLEGDIRVPPNGEVTVRVNADIRIQSDARIDLRVRVGDKVASPGIRSIASDDRAAVFGQTYASFVIKGLNQTGAERQERVRVEWSSTSETEAILGARTVLVSAERNEQPDVTGKLSFGGGNPEQGRRRVLAIMAQTRKDGNLLPTREEVDEWLFGDHSVAGLWSEISGGKLQLVRAGVVGPYELPRPYATYGDVPCDDEASAGFVTGGREIWMTMLRIASERGDVDFSIYDDDRDGIVTDKELAILFVMPRTTGGATRHLVNCSNAPSGRRITLNGVELYGKATQWGASATSIGTAAHELGHVLFGLEDMYVDEEDLTSEAGSASLMGNTGGGMMGHLDAPHKIALGWATPVVLTESGRYTIEDIAYSREAFVLPRRDGLGSEYIVIENRQEKPPGHPRYDQGIRDSGIAVWHVIDPRGENSEGLLDSPPRCAGNAWARVLDGSRNTVRRAIRLVRPGVSMLRDNHNFFDAQWGDLEDRSAFWLPCPANSDQPGIPLLQWADGTPSGYSLRNFSQAGREMTFDLVVHD
jgi:M6 family metalloprotease-like protein